MIGDAAARFFRTVNSKIITSRPGVFRKFLKVMLLFSYRLFRTLPDGKDADIVIKNFDSDIRMVINPSRTMGKAIYWTGFHELKELMFLHHFLKPEMVFVDIGANMGEYSLFAAKRVSSGRVYSFEPLPRMLTLLKRNLQINQYTNIEVIPFGLSDKPAELTIFDVKDRHEGLATLYPGTRESNSTHQIQLRVLDEEIDKYSLHRLDFIKIDIEGSELPALKGARQSILRFKPHVMVEINDSTYAMAGYSSADVLAFFTELNYRAFQFNKDAELVPCKALPVFGNIIFKAV